MRSIDMETVIRILLVILLLAAAPTWAQLRVVSLNSSNSSSDIAGPRAGMQTILAAIGASVSDDPLIAGDSGITRPIDILCLQEAHPTLTAPAYASLLNQIYATDRYAAGTLAGATTGFGTQTVVYNTDSVTLVSSAAVGTASTAGQPRQTLRHQFRPMGYTSEIGDVWIYNAHFKAGGTSTDQARRLIEAEAIRADANGLTSNNVIYLGDFNTARATDDSYERLLAAGTRAAIDPINKSGTWLDNDEHKSIHTQSPFDPSLNVGFNGTMGGVDDRFDFQLVTAAIMNGTDGLQYALNSYHAFGNNGSHAMNFPINTGTAQPPAVLNALAGILDHLPVVADYQLVPRPGLAYLGDADLDYDVDLNDFTILAANFGATQATWHRGDFTDDQLVNLNDFTPLAANFGTSAPLPRSIPEPATAIFLMPLLARRRFS